jgi:hypothetical protein
LKQDQPTMVQLGSVSLSGILVIRQQWLPAELGIRVIKGWNGQLIMDIRTYLVGTTRV